MKSSKLIELFHAQVQTLAITMNPEPFYALEDAATAILFGDDQFKVDYRKNRVRLPDVGWLDLGEPLPKDEKPDVVAVVQADGGFELQFLFTDNPFDPEGTELPVKNGAVVATPHALVDQYLKK
ncbi:MAG: hypothetical protein GY833_21860 [Aestuariibacter sp.]|nr:hypothetical protein [Aestuariibacter sp.]